MQETSSELGRINVQRDWLQIGSMPELWNDLDAYLAVGACWTAHLLGSNLRSSSAALSSLRRSGPASALPLPSGAPSPASAPLPPWHRIGQDRRARPWRPLSSPPAITCWPTRPPSSPSPSSLPASPPATARKRGNPSDCVQERGGRRARGRGTKGKNGKASRVTLPASYI